MYKTCTYTCTCIHMYIHILFFIPHVHCIYTYNTCLWYRTPFWTCVIPSSSCYRDYWYMYMYKRVPLLAWSGAVPCCVLDNEAQWVTKPQNPFHVFYFLLHAAQVSTQSRVSLPPSLPPLKPKPENSLGHVDLVDLLRCEVECDLHTQTATDSQPCGHWERTHRHTWAKFTH